MSLEERMDGVLSANKPIDAEFCKRVGMEEWEHGWRVRREEVVEVVNQQVFVTGQGFDCTSMPSVNTQGRFLHLLQALGIEVPG